MGDILVASRRNNDALTFSRRKDQLTEAARLKTSHAHRGRETKDESRTPRSRN
jgi:hypothetical protein